MKPPAFEYHRPASLAEALEVLGELGDEARPLAGGQSLIPLLNFRLAQPRALVDLDRIPDLRGLQERDGWLHIRAMTREVELEGSPAIPAMVAAALPHIGHFQIRSRGTVGGSLAHLDPAAEWPALVLALGARITLVSRRGQRTLAPEEFILGSLWSDIQADELLLEVAVPTAAAAWGFAEVARRPGDFALAGAACTLRNGSWRVAVFACGGGPHRLGHLEQRLAEGLRPGPELIAVAEQEIAAAGDIHASLVYRRRVGAALVERVVKQACS